MRLKRLADVRKPRHREVSLLELPQDIRITAYAQEKAYAINDLVPEIFGRSYEWYGFTLGRREQPEVIVDIGLPVNELNEEQYVSLAAEEIAAFAEELPAELLINGWIHSHGNLELQQFSHRDDANQATVLDFVAAGLRLPVAKVEVAIQDLVLLQEGCWQEADLQRGSVTLITDVPVASARIWEMEYGGFSFAIVIGDSGWHDQEIYYKKRGILSGRTMVSHIQAQLAVVPDGRRLTVTERQALADLVRRRLAPQPPAPVKLEGL